jgi:hypothetical protein
MKATHNPTLDTSTDPATNPAALLRGAVIYLQTHGWTQGQFYDLLANTDGPFPPACASGAIMSAATGQCHKLGIVALVGDEDHETVAAIRAMRAFADWINDGYIPENYPVSAIDIIGDWNDDKGRTLAEVLEALTDAANDWQAAHPTGGAR